MATVCENNKIDSNITGLRIAQEVCLKTLPSTANGDPQNPIWYALEPDKYADMGGTITTVARNPINPSRQNRKGVVTDLDAKVGFTTDLTQTNLTWMLQGFMFATAREKLTTASINSAAVAITAVVSASKEYSTTKIGFAAGNIVFAQGFNNVANNGVKTVASISAGEVVVNEVCVDEGAPPATASLTLVGHQFAAGDISVVMNGSLPQLTSAAVDMSTLGLVPGEWIYVGGDAALTQLALNKPGFARIGRITTTFLELDKSQWTPAADAGATKTLQIFMGTVIKNEDDPTLITRRSYQLERTLGNDTNGVQSQYVVGAVADTMTMNVKQADKVTMDLAWVACDAESYTGLQGLKTGTRPALAEEDAFNTSSDITRISLAIIDPTTSTPVPLVAYCTDATLAIKNNVSGSKAIGVLGAFDTTVGTFDVSGSLTAYFEDVRAIQAVRENADVTLDIVLCKNNAGLVFDIPLITLGNGLPAVQQNQAITIPLDTKAAQSSFGHTLLYVAFPYLPTVAS